MKKAFKILSLLTLMTVFVLGPSPMASANEGTMILCYHDIPNEVDLDNFGTDQRSFIDAIEYFKTHGYSFISLDDLILSRNGKKKLPEKAILLTFDDAYASYYEFVYPMLKEYKIPSTLAVVTSWIGADKPDDIKHDLMTWEQIREVASTPYVEVISHSHNLHTGVVYNPQGNTAAAAVSRQYDTASKTYEDENAFAKRVGDDLKTSKDLLEEKTGQKIRAIAWPYGQYNEKTRELGKAIGLEAQFTLNDKVVTENRYDQINRFLIHKNPTISDLLKDLSLKPKYYPQERIVQVDLDMIYDADPEQVERNLGALLDRIKDLRVTTVYLQAFSDNKATGNIGEVYFPNSILPVKQDLFNRVAHQLKVRTEVKVYAWMPMLSLDLPQALANDDHFVREYSDGETPITSSWYKRLSPFSPQVKEILTKLYRDLAIHANIDGVVFQDDGYLNEDEDFHPAALEKYKKITGKNEITPPYELSFEQGEAWTDLKIQELNDLSVHLINVMKRYRPEIRSARTLYAPVMMERSARKRFGQNYQESLKLYDYVVIMAYPYLEEVKNPTKWFGDLVALASQQPNGIEKTVFKIQTYDWSKKKWVKSRILNKWFKALVSSGARHIAYYPDDYHLNNPRASIIRETISVENFPFKRDWK